MNVKNKRYLQVRTLLEQSYVKYHTREFLRDDPVGVLHTLPDDPREREIGGLLIAVLSWGMKKIIINKCGEIINLMEGRVFDFIMNASNRDIEHLRFFRHRTFGYKEITAFINAVRSFTDKCGTFCDFFKKVFYDTGSLLETSHLFVEEMKKRGFSYGLGDIKKNSPSKRLFMYLRWMVRKDSLGIDLGIWNFIPPSQLIIPCDIRTIKVCRYLGLIHEKSVSIRTAIRITDFLRGLDAYDPVKYDFAIQGLFEEIFGGGAKTNSSL